MKDEGKEGGGLHIMNEKKKSEGMGLMAVRQEGQQETYKGI